MKSGNISHKLIVTQFRLCDSISDEREAITAFENCQESDIGSIFAERNKAAEIIMSTKIYHNPRCSKSRQTLQILQDKGVETEVIEYLKTPPDKATLEKILTALQMEPRDLMRKGQDEYKALALDNPDLSRDELIAAMLENPVLIERPIVLTAKGVAIGRPPESVLEVLE